MEEIKLGMVGLGTVGSGVLEMVQKHAAKISAVTGRKLALKTVVVRNLAKHAAVAQQVHLTTDLNEILTDPEIKIVVEVMGGIHPAKEVITQLLTAHKHVVTANKDLIATEGAELMAIGNAQNDESMIEAAGIGVAMGNSIPSTLACADVVVADNNHDGIAEAIEKYVLN